MKTNALHEKSIIIFAKHPTPGMVKTRLIETLGASGAAAFYECMLLDTLERSAEIDCRKVVYYSDTEGAAEYFAAHAAGMARRRQAAGNLGVRMEAALSDALAEGVTAAAIIGSDSPDLPGEYVEEAFRLLEGDADAVFGPSDDGGYYLVAMKRVHPELFRGIPWSSAETLATTLRQGEAAGIRIALLPPWYDVDKPGDLQRESLLREECPAIRTRKFLVR